MANPYTYVSFQSPDDQRRYDHLNNVASTMQQASMSPQMDPNGQYSWAQGMGQLAQALAAANARHKANQMTAKPQTQAWTGTDSKPQTFAGPDISMIGQA